MTGHESNTDNGKTGLFSLNKVKVRKDEPGKQVPKSKVSRLLVFLSGIGLRGERETRLDEK